MSRTKSRLEGLCRARLAERESCADLSSLFGGSTSGSERSSKSTTPPIIVTFSDLSGTSSPVYSESVSSDFTDIQLNAEACVYIRRLTEEDLEGCGREIRRRDVPMRTAAMVASAKIAALYCKKLA